MGRSTKRRSIRRKPLILSCHFDGEQERKAKLLLLKWERDDAAQRLTDAHQADLVNASTAGVDPAQPPAASGATGAGQPPNESSPSR
jgi:hypothetical protein